MIPFEDTPTVLGVVLFGFNRKLSDFVCISKYFLVYFLFVIFCIIIFFLNLNRIHSQSVQWSHLQRHDSGDRCFLFKGIVASLQK
jgi:hypothetical protein